ncbi:MAG TPA: lactonase family protein [Chitinophagaceae bacterium]|nr:lactonase family protein [Chitinophagaceae bacterium]
MRFLLFVFLGLSFQSQAQEFYLFAGTYTGSGSKGIYVYRFNAATGTAEAVSSTDSSNNPSYLAIAPDGQHVYAVNETGGDQPGSVSAYAFDRTSGQLTFLNSQPTGGDHPCYISVDRTGKWAVVANYTGGNLSAFTINDDGTLQPYAQLEQHTGSSANKERQEKAHVHAAVFSPDQKFLFSPDLGMDKLTVYQFDKSAKEPLQPAAVPFVKSTPGNGPRHFTFSPNQKFAYLVEELSGTVAAFAYKNGKLTFLQRTTTHPAGYKGAKGSADIHLSPDGKFLYVSNRGDANSIAVFSVAATGKLQLKGIQSTLGEHPRNFIIDPTGKYLLVANRDSDAVVIFKRNAATGLLRDTGKRIQVPKPVCLQMLK